jgi:hypothetical protein
MPEAELKHLFSEEGFFEEFSIVLWVVAALVVIIKGSPLRSIHFAVATLFVLRAMREADWHKKFTTEGIFKLNYYTKSVAPLTEKIPAACVLILFIGLVIYSLFSGYKYLRSAENRRCEALWVMVLGVALFFFGKILDRSNSVLAESFGIILSNDMKRFIGAYEEGLEMVTPLLLALAFLWPKRTLFVSRSASA